MNRNLDRLLAARAAPLAHGAVPRRLALVALVLALVGAVVSQLNVRRDLHRLDAGFASGSRAGSSYALVGELAEMAAREKGRLRNVASGGAVDNVARLRAARSSCEIAFALAQDGTDWGAPGELEIVGRLAKAESVVFVGKDADSITELSQLAHAKIGTGPEGTGSARLARDMFALPELRALDVQLEPHPLPEELAMLADGRLTLGVAVTDADSPWLAKAAADGLELAGFAHLDALARRVPHVSIGRIGAGDLDPVKVLPKTDKPVLRVEALVVGNGCAGRSATLDLMTVLQRKFPDFVRHNKETPNTTGLELAPAARGFFEHEGPELADEYVPWLVDVMPPANWAYVVMAVSLLFNAMGLGHRFRLWRIDAARVKLEAELATLFGPTTTLGDIARARPEDAARAAAERARIEEIIRELEALAARSRRQSLSVLVPMGQEMAYRYQEGVIYETLAVLRDFLRRTATLAV